MNQLKKPILNVLFLNIQLSFWVRFY